MMYDDDLTALMGRHRVIHWPGISWRHDFSLPNLDPIDVRFRDLFEEHIRIALTVTAASHSVSYIGSCFRVQQSSAHLPSFVRKDIFAYGRTITWTAHSTIWHQRNINNMRCDC
jgi:hypothetical protein